ncbi:MAG: hypothetical protein IPM39_13970 [Chloroflexi bacterium]|nr:hypothetical protein [Chloroflexota bacterium]
MNHKRISVLFVSIAAAFVAMTLLFSSQHALQASPNAAPAASPFVTEYPLPNTGAPRYLIRTGSSSFWFTAPGVNAIGHLIVTDTLTYGYTFYTIPTANSDPYQLASDGSNIWFTQRAGNKIGKLVMATGVFTEYPIPTGDSAPTGITIAPDGLVWFVQRTGNKVAKLDPDTGQITEYAYTRPNANLEDIAAAPNGTMVWFTAPAVQKLASFTISSETFDDTSTSDPVAGIFTPNQTAVNTDNVAWVSTTNGLIGFDFGTTISLFRWYTAAPASANLSDLLLVNSGSTTTAWFSDSASGYVGRVTTNSNGSIASSWRFPLLNRTPQGIQVDANQVIWLADSQNHMIIRWEPPYFFVAYLPSISIP